MRFMMLFGFCLMVNSVLSVSVLSSSAGAQEANWNALSPGTLHSGLNENQVKYGGELRRLVVVAPKAFDKAKNYPILFCFHGAGGDADKQIARWRRHVDSRNLILVGVDAVQSLKKWNFKEDFHGVNHDDVGLIREVIKALISNGLADAKAIYATGHSSGGLFCYRLAKESSLFAAVCPMSCGMAKGAHDPGKSTAPVHLMQVIGDRDKSYLGTTNPKVTMYSAEQRIAVWRAFNECKSKPVTKAHGKEIKVQTYTNSDGIELAICEAKGQGHHLRLDLRDAADVIALDFMLKHRK
ncbi:MAG: alpha/beta hydrolase family esterase [Rubripirellula sp.]